MTISIRQHRLSAYVRRPYVGESRWALCHESAADGCGTGYAILYTPVLHLAVYWS